MLLLKLFSDNLLPVFIAAATGWLLARLGRVDPRPLAQAGFYIFSPCLVFQVITDNRLPIGALLRMGAFSFAALLILGGIIWVVARALRWSRSMTAAAVLVVMLPNAGNFGLSANLFAFGDAGLAQASLFFITSAVLSYTIGVLVASLGRMSVRDALISLVKVPAIWAVPVAFVVSHAGWSLPVPVGRSVKLLSDACIPSFLVILGMQLATARHRGPVAPVALATALRLVGSIVVGLVLARLLHMTGAARQAAVFQAAMPTAVISTILAAQYDVEPDFVTAVIFVTTILSPLTLTPLIAGLQH